MIAKGLTLSFITTVLFATFEVCFRYAAVAFDVHPVIFTSLAFFVAATMLIIIAGPGQGGLKTLRRPHTWAFGAMEILMNISVMFALAYITTTEMNFLARATMIFALLIGWVFLGRPPKKYDVFGILLVLGGLIYVAWEIDPAIRAIVLFCMFWVSLTSTLRTVIAETHPESGNALTIRQRCRVSGYVLMVSSFCFLFFAFTVGFLKSSMPFGDLPILLQNAPGYGDIVHKPTVYGGIILGVTIIPLAMYFYFYATRVAKTEVFIMVTSFLPFSAYAVEYIFHLFDLLDISSVSNGDLAAGAVMTLGALVMLYGRKDTHLDKKNAKNIINIKLDKKYDPV